MYTRKSLYEPKLVELWNERYRDFEIDEMVRRLHQNKKNMQSKAEADAPDNPQSA